MLFLYGLPLRSSLIFNMQSTTIRHRRPVFRHAIRSKQRGYGEDLFLAVILGYPLLVLLISVVAFSFAMIAGVRKGTKLVLIGVVAAVLSPLWIPIFETMSEVDKSRAAALQWNAIRLKSLDVCKKDVDRLPETLPVDNINDETGGLRPSDIEYLLVTKRLRFIEVKLGINPGLIAKDDNKDWPSSRNDGYAHLELGHSPSPNCYFPGGDKSFFFSSRAPVKPGTCLQLTYLETPQSVNALIETPSTIDPKFSRWSLVNRGSDTTIASVTDAFRQQTYRSTTPYWERRSGSYNRCENGTSGYGLLLDRLSGSNDSIAATNQWVMNQASINIDGVPPTREAAKKLFDSGRSTALSFNDAPYVGTRESLREHTAWTEAYAYSIQHGALVYENQLIVPSANTLYRIQYEGLSGKWVSTGTQLIFVASIDIQQIAIFGVSFQGKLLWSGQITPTNLWYGFIPERFEMTGSELLIHGINVHRNDESPPWTIRLSLSELKGLQ